MTITAKGYHWSTRYDRYDMSGHRLDWASQPSVYKVYPGMKYLDLPRPENLPQLSLQEAVAPFRQTQPAPLTLNWLSAVLALAYGITGRTRSGEKDFFYRSAPSAGALYPVEIYLASGSIDALAPGLYHYDVAGRGLCQLRVENVMATTGQCLLLNNTSPPPVAAFFLSAIYYRSSWKYRKRAFRYVLLDTGHVLENLVMVLRAHRIEAEVHYDIDRELSDHFLGCDPERETCFACVRIPGSSSPITETHEIHPPLSKAVLDASRVSKKEDHFEEIQQISRAASRLPAHTATSSDMSKHLGIFPEKWQPLKTVAPNDVFNFTNTLMHRRSRRNYIPGELPGKTFWGVLDILSLTSKRHRPPFPPYGSSLATGLLTQNVENVADGFHLCNFSNNQWGLVRRGAFVPPMAAACLNQMWLQNAALHVCFLANLDQLDRIWGARGYQYAMLEAGRLGETVYLAASAMGLGCCGIGALYDDEARRLLDLNESSALLYLVAVGPVKAMKQL